MEPTYEPSSLLGGKYGLGLLKQSTCPNFRALKDSICEALCSGKYDEHALGATRVEILEFALGHAQKVLLIENRGRQHFVDVMVVADIKCALTAAQNAQGKQIQASSNIHVLEKKKAQEDLAA